MLIRRENKTPPIIGPKWGRKHLGSHGVYFYEGYGEEDENGSPGPDRGADLAEEYFGGEEVTDKDHEEAA